MSSLRLPRVECSGSARALGHAQGEALKPVILAFVEQRLAAFRSYSHERGGPSVDRFLAAGKACFEVAADWDPQAAVEQAAIAEAAGLDVATLYGATNMTDVRDVLLLPGSADEGCTSLLVPAAGSRTGELLVGQTWDLNPTDLEFVVAIHRRPTEGPETWSVTCAGALSLMGMNAEGVAVGTTNIKTRRSRIGVGYLSILHRAIRAGSAAAALSLVREAPRAAAHTFWIADADFASELECDPGAVSERRLGASPLARTNHCLSARHREVEGEAPSSSSRARLARAERLLSSAPQDVDSLRALMTDRSDGVDSINRFAEDQQGTTTNACLIAVPARRELWACRGSADRGSWSQLAFD